MVPLFPQRDGVLFACLAGCRGNSIFLFFLLVLTLFLGGTLSFFSVGGKVSLPRTYPFFPEKDPIPPGDPNLGQPTQPCLGRESAFCIVCDIGTNLFTAFLSSPGHPSHVSSGSFPLFSSDVLSLRRGLPYSYVCSRALCEDTIGRLVRLDCSPFRHSRWADQKPVACALP